jgi:DNA polymerase-3 subunit delta
MSKLGPCYLVHGSDHGAVAERRASLIALARSEGNDGSIEMLEGEGGTPAGVANALRVMTFALGRRVIIVDGVERWKEAEVKEHIAPALADMPPDTTLALFAREEGRATAPAALHSAVKRVGGQTVEHATVKPWELAGWVREQSMMMGLRLDMGAAKAFVSQVGERQQRLMRELEKLALERGIAHGEAAITISPEDVEERAARSAESRVFALVDALIAGDAKAATSSYLSLREQGERLAGCIYVIARGLRDALDVSLRLARGESTGEVKRSLRMPPRAAERYITVISRSTPERLRSALTALANLELDSRGGSILSGSRSAIAATSEDTLMLRSIEKILA